MLNKSEYPSGLPLDSLAATFHQQSQVHVFYNCFVWPLSLRSWVIIALISILSFAYEQLAPSSSFLKGDVYAVMAGMSFTFLSAHVYYHFKFGEQVTIQKDRLIFSEYWINKGKPKALNFDSIKFIIVERSNYRWLFKADKAWWRAHFYNDNGKVLTISFFNFLFLPTLVAYLARHYQIPIRFNYPREIKVLFTMLAVCITFIGYLMLNHHYPHILEWQ